MVSESESDTVRGGLNFNTFAPTSDGYVVGGCDKAPRDTYVDLGITSNLESTLAKGADVSIEFRPQRRELFVPS